MRHRVKSYTLTYGGLSLLLGIMLVGTMTIKTFTAFAANGPQGACGSSIVVDNSPPGTSASCDMGITTNFNSGTLSYTNDANATTSASVVVGNNPFSFGTTIVDLRNINAGWRLEAQSAGLTNSFNSVTTTIPLNITSSTATCAPTDGQATCVTPTGRAITLNTTSQYFLTTGSGSTVISGTFNATTNGTYTFTGGEPAGTYTGTITIALVNAF